VGGAAWKNGAVDLAVLVSVEHDGARMGVVRDGDGSAWLAHTTERACGTRLDECRPYEAGLADDCTLLGGLLPRGAVSAEVVDDAGERHAAAAANGAYVTVLNQPITGEVCPVCCRDERGAPVAPVLPASWARRAVPDAEEPCPACDAVAWDEVRPDDESRGTRGAPDGGMEPSPAVVCRSCGHEERAGAWITIEHQPDVDPEAIARARRAYEQAQHDHYKALLAELDFPIYAAAGFSATIAGYGGPTSGLDGPVIRVNSISVAQTGNALPQEARLVIETALNNGFERSERALARRELEGWLHAEMPPPRVVRSEAGRTIAWHTVDRERRKLAARAQVRTRSLLVDGQQESFTVLEVGARSVAVHQLSGLTITVSAYRIDPGTLRLRPIERPVEELLGDQS
jgi:hypothetical protein